MSQTRVLSKLFLCALCSCFFLPSMAIAQDTPPDQPQEPEARPENDESPERQRRRDRRGRRARSGFFSGARPRQEDPRYVARLAPYAELVTPMATHTCGILVEGRPRALATVVDDGLLLTKASEITDRRFEVDLGNALRCEAEIEHVFDEHDLALIRVPVRGLRPVQWAAIDSLSLLPGSFVACGDASGTPVAAGVISAPVRSLSSDNQGYLGVNLGAADDGVRLTNVEPDSPASAAGLLRDDVVMFVEDERCESTSQLIRAISSRSPGDTIRLRFLRGDQSQETSVTLGSRAALESSGANDDSSGVSNMGTELSDVRSGYPVALQHDLAIRPQDCGGILVDLDGRPIALNIARASRVSSYAIPAAEIVKLLHEWKTEQ
ncbi:MAG: PDZ domain-containing protein [Planctomycetota bacterium]